MKAGAGSGGRLHSCKWRLGHSPVVTVVDEELEAELSQDPAGSRHVAQTHGQVGVPVLPSRTVVDQGALERGPFRRMLSQPAPWNARRTSATMASTSTVRAALSTESEGPSLALTQSG